MRDETDLAVLELEPPRARRRLVRQAAPVPIAGVIVGRIIAIDAGGQIAVDFPGSPFADGAIARSTVSLCAKDRGREAVLMFEEADVRRPIIIGLMQPPVVPIHQAEVDGKTLTFEAENEIVLRCGKSSMTLTREGKVLIRGTYLLSRSSGVNRIKGGAVQIN